MKHAIDDAISSIRTGDTLKVPTLDHLGPSLVDALQRIETVHAKGAVVVETSTGLRSDRDLLAMIKGALPKLRKGTSQRVARRSGKKGGRPPKTDRLPDAEALPIWTDTAILTNAAALRRMPGWTEATAYKRLGESGRINLRGAARRKARRKS